MADEILRDIVPLRESVQHISQAVPRGLHMAALSRGHIFTTASIPGAISHRFEETLYRYSRVPFQNNRNRYLTGRSWGRDLGWHMSVQSPICDLLLSSMCWVQYRFIYNRVIGGLNLMFTYYMGYQSEWLASLYGSNILNQTETLTFGLNTGYFSGKLTQ